MRNEWFETKVVDGKKVVVSLDESCHITVAVDEKIVRYITGRGTEEESVESFEKLCRILAQADTIHKLLS